MANENMTPYFSRRKKNKFRILRAELDAREIRRAERKEQEEAKRKLLRKELKQIARQGL